jgi:hypothetical protein
MINHQNAVAIFLASAVMTSELHVNWNDNSYDNTYDLLKPK